MGTDLVKVHARLEDAQRLAAATGGHVVTRHYAEGYDFIVVPGPDPRRWPKPANKKREGGSHE